MHETPLQVIKARAAGEITSSQMMQILKEWEYAPDQWEPDNPLPALISGDWSDIPLACALDIMSWEEHDELADHLAKRDAELGNIP